ncbi:MAG: hypothetical protein IT371_08085 [Deltaproteobacteria bacterium]|nr:hypothetical protein [Deltaproteobacteria bacterium]
MTGATEKASPAKRPRRPVLRVALGLVLVGTALGVALAYSKLSRFVERDQRFCALCHRTQKEYSLWTKNEHRTIVCQQCHHQSRGAALSMLGTYVWRGGKSADGRNKLAKHAKVDLGSCESCHAQHDAKWKVTRRSAGHRSHAKTSCLRCHARSVHRFTDALDSCADCHKQEVHGAKGMEKLHCTTCHNFLTGRDDELRPGPSTCLGCHQARGVKQVTFPSQAPMAHLACYSCHRPHAQAGPRTVDCAACHDRQSVKGLHATPGHARCLSCHQLHDWATPRDRCLGCHKPQATKHHAERRCQSCHSFLGAGERR